MTIFVSSYYENIPQEAVVINTTSRSTNWSKELSPFFLGPVNLYDGMISKNVENAWQFAKVYSNHLDENGNPNSDYLSWAKKGWNDTYAHRYPMGKGAIPKYSYWGGQKLSYIEARKQIYIPLYAQAVSKTIAFSKLSDFLLQEKDVYLIDFDGFNNKKLGMSYHDVINCESRKMGHAFVLAMMLEKYINNDGEMLKP